MGEAKRRKAMGPHEWPTSTPEEDARTRAMVERSERALIERQRDHGAEERRYMARIPDRFAVKG